MAWNEPGGNNKDPWGNKNNSDGPPDFDEILKNFFGKFSSIFGGGKGGSGNNSNDSASIALIAGVFAVIVIAFYLYKGMGIVNEQERAVVLRFGSYIETKGPGFRWNPPLIDTVFTENVTRVRPWTANEQMLTKDLNIVDIKLSVQYAIADARDFILNVKSPEMSLQQAANSALRHVVGSTEMHNVLTEGRALVAVEIQTRLQDYLDGYGAGITIEKVNVEDTNPPQEVQEAFDDVIRAREDEERYKNEAEAYANDKIPRARGAARRIIEEAKAYRSRVTEEAKGEAERFELLLAEYKKAPEVTRSRLYIDAIENVMGNASKVMVDIEGGNNMMYLPLDKMLEQNSSVGGRRGFTESEVQKLTDHIIEKVRREGVSSSRRGGSKR